MQAIVHDRYGGPEVLELRAVDRPTLDDDRVLIRVHAASVNAYDWQDDLRFLGQLVVSGQVTPVIEQSYQLAEVPEAIRRIGNGHAKGKLVVAI